MTIPLPDDAIVHRVGGADVAGLQLKPAELEVTPPGISVLRGGTPGEASGRIRAALPTSRKWRRIAGTVGTATVGAIRAVGYDVIADPSDKLPDHARLIHPAGAAGFGDDNLAALSAVFLITTGW